MPSPRLVPSLQRAVHTAAAKLAPTLDDLDLTLAEANVLAQLAAAGPQTIGELQRAFGHRRSTLTSVLDRLEQSRHVRRTVHERDRRTFTIAPTARGTRAGRRLLAELEAMERLALARVPPADAAAFWRVLDSLGD